MVIALGYGQLQGVQHRSKDLSAVSDCCPDDPDWYRAGAENGSNRNKT